MDLLMASVRDVDQWRWRDRRTLVAIVAALVVGAAVGVIAGLVAGSDIVTEISTRPEVPSSLAVVDGLDGPRAVQVGGLAALVVGVATMATLRLRFVEIARSQDRTRRRALILGSIAALGIVGPWFALGWKLVTIRHTTFHPVPVVPPEPLAQAIPWSERFYAFDLGPALIGMVMTFVAVAVIGSLFRRPSSDAETRTDTPTP